MTITSRRKFWKKKIIKLNFKILQLWIGTNFLPPPNILHLTVGAGFAEWAPEVAVCYRNVIWTNCTSVCVCLWGHGDFGRGQAHGGIWTKSIMKTQAFQGKDRGQQRDVSGVKATLCASWFSWAGPCLFLLFSAQWQLPLASGEVSPPLVCLPGLEWSPGEESWRHGEPEAVAGGAWAGCAGHTASWGCSIPTSPQPQLERSSVKCGLKLFIWCYIFCCLICSWNLDSLF